MAVLCILGCIGCGGSAETPVQKCDDLINDVCDRGVECIPQQTGTHANCVQQLQQVLACGSAKKVSASYNRCIEQIKGDGCQVLFPTDPQTGQPTFSLPADCMGVIEMFEPGGQIGSSPFHRASQLSTVSGE
jgi:hypothetical protein